MALLLCGIMQAGAATWTDDNGINWTFDAKNGGLSGGTIATNIRPTDKTTISGTVAIPETVYIGETALTVVSIASQAFKSCENLTGITLPSGLETIGEEAFYGTGIRNLKLPEGLKTIGPGAFQNNIKLYDLEIPSTVESIGEQAFYNCYWLGTIICKVQSPLDLGGNSLTINPYAMGGQVSLFVPNGCKDAYLTVYPWMSCDVREDRVSYRNSQGIRYLQFEDEQHMEVLHSDYSGDITIPSTVPVKTLSYPVTALRASAFHGCSDLTSVTFQSTSNVESIGNYAFYQCTNLTSVTIPASVTSIGGYSFSNTGLTSVTIPANVTTIGSHAFSYTGLTSVTIPANVTSIGFSPFGYCGNLEAIQVNGNNSFYDSRNGCNAIIEKATNTLIQGCSSTVIPNDVTQIGWSAFCGLSNLTSITIPENVTIIDKWAFEGTSLSEVTIPEGVTTIYYCSFRFNNNLSSVSIPSTVTLIERAAFYESDNINKVYCYAMTPPEIEESDSEPAFTNPTNATLYVPYGKKSAYQSAPYWQDFTIEEMAPDDVTLTIGRLGVGTFASPYDLNFAGITGMKAYIASGFNPSTGKLVLTQVDEVPAGTGLYVKGTAGTYTIPVQETSMYLHNMLVGVTERTYLEATTGDNTNFTLQNGSHGLGFYAVSPGYLNAGKAYLSIPTWVLSAQAGPIMLEFEDEETTGINLTPSTSLEGEGSSYYTIDGQKLEGKPIRKGVYVVNGKKVVIN